MKLLYNKTINYLKNQHSSPKTMKPEEVLMDEEYEPDVLIESKM